METIQVICPSCSEWRSEEVSREEISNAMCSDSLPIAMDCRPCADKNQLAFELRHPESYYP